MESKKSRAQIERDIDEMRANGRKGFQEIFSKAKPDLDFGWSKIRGDPLMENEVYENILSFPASAKTKREIREKQDQLFPESKKHWFLRVFSWEGS